ARLPPAARRGLFRQQHAPLLPGPSVPGHRARARRRGLGGRSRVAQPAVGAPDRGRAQRARVRRLSLLAATEAKEKAGYLPAFFSFFAWRFSFSDFSGFFFSCFFGRSWLFDTGRSSLDAT